LLKREALLASRSGGKPIRMSTARQLAMTAGKHLSIQAKVRRRSKKAE
jgi:hypothetical protein